MIAPHTELKQSEPTRQTLAEAAAWLARLHRPQRSPEDEAGFRRWLAEQPTHARAWELASAMWETAQRIPLSALTPNGEVTRSRWRRRGWHLMLATALASIIIASMLPLFTNPQVKTTVGEQRVMTLDDGSRVIMNTATRIVVRYTEQSRRVLLREGEAMFEVAKNLHRPFVVEVDGREIMALGTAFVVRRDRERVAVTLVEGRIAIAPITLATLAPVSTLDVLEPGERLTFVDHEAPTRDRPPLDSVTAWQRGVAIFDNTPLLDATMEMNRYNSGTSLRVDDSEIRTLAVSGVFRLGDSGSFARAVAQGYGLTMLEKDGQILLTSGHR